MAGVTASEHTGAKQTSAVYFPSHARQSTGSLAASSGGGGGGGGGGVACVGETIYAIPF